jgi:hypothetical protein
MAKFQLSRSGGQFGKTARAMVDIDLSREEIDAIGSAQIEPRGPRLPDDISYSVAINNTAPILIDVSRLPERLQKIVEDLEPKLKSE